MKSVSTWFEGRINRREFFARGMVSLALTLLAYAPNILHFVGTGPRFFRSGPEKLLAWPVMIIYALLYVGYILPAIVRRLHDCGKSGWWVVGFIVFKSILRNTLGAVGVQIGEIGELAFGLFLFFWPGTKGPNEYGEVPQFDDRKLMGGHFATILVVLYLLEAAICGWIVVDRRAREDAAKIPIPQVEVDGMLANLAKAAEIENYVRFNRRMDGRRLTLTNLTVVTTHSVDFQMKEVDCRTAEGVNVLLYVSANVMDALPDDFVHDDWITRVEGRVFTSLDGLTVEKVKLPSYCNAIWLEADKIDVSWQTDLQSIDPAISGDELTRLAAGLKVTVRQRKCARLCRVLLGRELEFSECRVDAFRFDAKIPCLTLVALDPESHRGGLQFSVPMDAAHAGPYELRGLHVGQKLRAVKAVVCAKGDKGDWRENLTAGVWMRRLEFTTNESTVALPSFDEATITGAGLVALLRAHRNRLSPIQIDELQRKLPGRHLTFSGMKLRSYERVNGKINDAAYAFGDIGLQLRVNPKPVVEKMFDSLKDAEGVTLTGTVAKEPANDAYGDRALRLVDCVVSIRAKPQ